MVFVMTMQVATTMGLDMLLHVCLYVILINYMLCFPMPQIQMKVLSSILTILWIQTKQHCLCKGFIGKKLVAIAL